MAKKIVVGVVGAALLGVFLFGTRFFGYVGTVVDKGRQAAQDSVPFELKLAEAKKKVGKLDDVIEKHMHLMAETKQQIDGLGTEIADREKALGVQLEELAHLRNLEKNADTEFVSVKTKTVTKDIPVAELKNEIDIRTGSYMRGNQGLETKRKSREEKQKQYTEFQKQYNELVTVKEQMELRIKELESKQAVLETRKAAEAAQYDDSDVKEAQEILDELDRGLGVESNMLDLKTGTGAGRIDLDLSGEDTNSRDQLDEILKKNDVKPADHLISIER
jgi:chromosome segregation ATPase